MSEQEKNSEQEKIEDAAPEAGAEIAQEEQAAPIEEAAATQALQAAQAEAADYKDKWMRAAAEFDNFRKRNEAARRNAYLDGKADILLKLFPVGDNLERALDMCDGQTKKGIEMVLRSFQKILSDEGVEVIDPKDEEFDPAVCEAIMSEPAAEGVEAGYVKEVFLKGYKRGDKVLRFAQVKVTT